MSIALRNVRFFVLLSLLVLLVICVIGLVLFSGFAHIGPTVGHTMSGVLAKAPFFAMPRYPL